MKIVSTIVLVCSLSLFGMEDFKSEIEKKYQHWDPLCTEDQTNQEPHKTVTLFLQALINKQLTFDETNQLFLINNESESPLSVKNFLSTHTNKQISLYEASVIIRGIRNKFLENRPINFETTKLPVNYNRSILEFDDFYSGLDLNDQAKNKSSILRVRKQLLDSIAHKIPQSISTLIKTNYQLVLPIPEKKSPKKNRKSSCHSQ